MLTLEVKYNCNDEEIKRFKNGLIGLGIPGKSIKTCRARAPRGLSIETMIKADFMKVSINYFNPSLIKKLYDELFQIENSLFIEGDSFP